MTDNVEKELKEEIDKPGSNSEYKASPTSIDIIWKQAFHELDEWVNQANYRDDYFLKQAVFFAETIKRNKENLGVVTEQFTKELAEWERTAREELLMTTTTLQHFLPKISYEEINQQIDQVQNKAIKILKAPCQVFENVQLMDQYISLVEQFISLRKTSRNKYINTIKQAAGLIYETQKGFVDLFSNQIKSLFLPFNKYMENSEELTK